MLFQSREPAVNSDIQHSKKTPVAMDIADTQTVMLGNGYQKDFYFSIYVL